MTVFAIQGCRGKGPASHDHAEKDAGITRSAQEGPVSVSLTVRPKAPDVSDTVHVHLEITSDTSVTISEPDYGHTLAEGDRVFEYRERAMRQERAKPIGDGRLRWVYDYDLHFVLAGSYELPAAEVSFTAVESDSTDAASQAGSVGKSVSTEPITLVVSAAGETALSDADLRTVARLDPVDLPRTWPVPAWLLVMALVAVLTVAALILWRRRRRREKIEIAIPADVWARRQLAVLLADELLEKGLVQEFYYRISAIVRGYIERRFNVSAPEMTTEEFLLETASDDRFGRDTSIELDRFLRACDLVKYAKHVPGPSECEFVLNAARDFVERTREHVAPDGSMVGGSDRDRSNGSTAEERAA